MATILDVARRAGVSTATVSHVINESRVVTPETKQRVLEAIEALHYRRDGIARSLRRSRTGTIGLVVSDITNPFFSELVRGVEDAIIEKHRDSNLILCNTDEDTEKERRSVETLLEKRIDGLIFAPAGGNESQISHLITRGVPVVMVDRRLPGVEADAVLVDNVQGAYELTAHLLGLGHRRIGVMRADLRAGSIEERLHGFEAAMSAAGVPVDPALIVTSPSEVDEATRVAASLIARPSVQRPSAVFCTNNFMTLGMLRAIVQERLRCPQDIAVAGFDDLPWALGFHPQLTAIAQPAYQMGQVAVDLLFARMSEGATHPPEQRKLETRLMVRESCGATLVQPLARSTA
ncbi:MAG: LacI family DNA-binding transcriptional regulator [Rubellimicrobium sp.]|nr:LacI family DNA-binding transcriptional regulator [Rubellimicrobium sp.]